MPLSQSAKTNKQTNKHNKIGDDSYTVYHNLVWDVHTICLKTLDYEQSLFSVVRRAKRETRNWPRA